jgi:hypothetical protein
MWILKAVFWLLAAVVATALLIILAAEAGCIWLIAIAQTEPIGACESIGAQVREVWSEMLTAILALLLAARSGGPPRPPEE